MSVTGHERRISPSQNDCQGHMQTPQSLSVVRADNFINFMFRLSRHLGASTSWNLSGPVQACYGVALTLPSWETNISPTSKIISHVWWKPKVCIHSPPPPTQPALVWARPIHLMPFFKIHFNIILSDMCLYSSDFHINPFTNLFFVTSCVPHSLPISFVVHW
jgi:hypothetical protein